MWARLESNTIKEILIKPKALTIGGVQYPSNVFSIWSNSELATIGIVPITIDSTNFKDKDYYINTDITYAYSTETGKATGTYGTATAKLMTDTLFTAEDEAADSNNVEGTVKNRGLKSEKKTQVNGTAQSLIQETDWMVIREADGGTAMPSNIKTYRAAVRTKANTHCTNIDNAADVDALAALTFDWPAKP